MNICNKPPNKTAPENLGEAVPEVQVQRARRNGWSWPLHIFQITGWLLCLFFALVGFGILVPLLPRHWLPAGYICPGVCFIYHLVVHLTAVSIDPADANVRAKNYMGPLATFNRNQHAHVIENHHCHVCDVNVSAKSKHCGTCNKCVCGFDHHCKWLNNCVGERNYWLFLNSVLSAILGLGLLLLIACYVFAEFFIDPTVLRSDHHFYVRNKLTTYEYILQHRFRQDVEEVENQQESDSYQMRSSQEADIFSGNPGYTDPGIQVRKFSTVTSGIGFSKLYAYGDEADPEQSSSPGLHFAVSSQRQKERRKWTHEASSSAVVSISKTHSSPWPSFSDSQSEFSTIPDATTSPHGLRLLVPSFPLQAAVPPSSSSLIQAAGPPADYHLESAESMDETPVLQNYLGSMALHRPPRNNSSNSQQHRLSADDPRGDRKKRLSSAHKVKRKSCQQDRHMEQNLELLAKVPAVFVSKSSGELHVSQPQLQ
ncbi:palmitoyltransferase ZDHHC1 isoform X2 [Pezoporus wallicus]|uniref:palmitoyltransferase ZDHHC1 isoform X2 n=1 Tax=Pezoporus wallicus TaxID=35540 RepID=UPI00254B9A25|nr:palmitoyltransferase ZDHHC1 isoform X2 [Pezoporus wallicus]